MKFNFPHPWVKDPETQQNNDAIKIYLDRLNTSISQTGVPRVTSLTPGVGGIPNPVTDGFEVVYVADATNGVLFPLRYNSGSASIYKWEAVGPSPLFSEVTTAESTVSTTYAALATAGPSIALPLAGDYEVGIGTSIFSDQANAVSVMSYDIGGTAAVDADNIFVRQPTAVSVQAHVARARLKTGLTAVTLTAKYKTTVAAGSNQFQNRWMRACPVRVG